MMTLSADGGYEMPRKRSGANAVPKLPMLVRATVKGRVVAEMRFGDNPGEIVPGSVALLVNPDSLTGCEKELAAWSIVKQMKLDVKCEYEKIYGLLWPTK